MPSSDPASHGPMVCWLSGLLLSRPRVLDCGVGAGAIGRRLRGLWGEGMTLTGLEVFARYVTDPAMRRHLEGGADWTAYDNLVLGPMADFRTWLPAAATDSQDVVVFGDSLEHVTYPEAAVAMREARRVARLGVVVNAPIGLYIQGPVPVLGNEYECHRLTLDRAGWEDLVGRYIGGSGRVGCFWAWADRS